jgi:hypothetical protein
VAQTPQTRLEKENKTMTIKTHVKAGDAWDAK